MVMVPIPQWRSPHGSVHMNMKHGTTAVWRGLVGNVADAKKSVQSARGLLARGRCERRRTAGLKLCTSERRVRALCAHNLNRKAAEAPAMGFLADSLNR